MRGMILLLLNFCVLLAAVAVLYAASPFQAAWAIREAVTAGDARYLASKVHWPAVRETMRHSMLRVALDPPPELLEETAAASPSRPGAWARLKHRVKAYAGRRVVDKMVDDYINAEGFPKLYRARQAKHAVIGPKPQEHGSALARFKDVWGRIKRAEFLSLTVFAIEIEDQFDAGRKYAATLELRGDEWILTELHIRDVNEITPVADAR